jgi:hypothetical protein
MLKHNAAHFNACSNPEVWHVLHEQLQVRPDPTGFTVSISITLHSKAFVFNPGLRRLHEQVPLDLGEIGLHHDPYCKSLQTGLRANAKPTTPEAWCRSGANDVFGWANGPSKHISGPASSPSLRGEGPNTCSKTILKD